MSVETPEPLALPDELLPLLADIDRRVARECAKHRAHYVQKFAAEVARIFGNIRDASPPGDMKTAWASAASLVAEMGGIEPAPEPVAPLVPIEECP